MENNKFGPIDKKITEEDHYTLHNDGAVGGAIEINNIDIFSSNRKLS